MPQLIIAAARWRLYRKEFKHRMKTIFIILIYFLPFISFGQETKEITVRFPKSKQIRESYFVLKSNKKIKNGSYIKYYKNSQKKDDNVLIMEQGTFINGHKDGEWTYYKSPSNSNQGRISTIKYYSNGIKTGIWKTYHYESDGTAIEQYDFDLKTKLEPSILVSLHYPFQSKEKGTQGEVVIKYLIKPDCSIEIIEILKSLDSDCDNEAIQSILKMGRLQEKYSINICDQSEEIKTIKFSLQ